MKNVLYGLARVVICAVLLTAPFLAGAQAPAAGEERIISYHSDIEVMADSSMVVTESIKVYSAGDQIRRGIYRDFPIAYKDKLGNRHLVGFDLLGVKRNGAPEPYHTERKGNGQRIYIGEEEVFIPSGEHTYEIKYRTTRQLGFFQDHDELYWNVTGNGWVFDIGQASARVKLPSGVPQQDIDAVLYTGLQGSTAQNGTWRMAADGAIEFQTSQPLTSYEGLTIVVSWPKGFVTPPTAAQGFWFNIWSNLDYILGTLGAILVLAYYVFFWKRIGRDPRKGTVIAQYEPPQGLSPAMMRYVTKMSSASKGLAAAIINLGVKGALSVTEEKRLLRKSTYTLSKKAALPDLPEEEKLLMQEFFVTGDKFEMKSKEAKRISGISESFGASLKSQAGDRYFKKNVGAIVGGIILSLLVLICAVIAAGFVRYFVDSLLPYIFWPVLVVGIAAINIVFGWLMRAYTPEGRRLVDEIEGFKLFLSVTEKDRLAFHNPPERTPELFEKMLPYALALDVEHKWAEQFADVFARMKNQGVEYAPAWYFGSFGHFTPTAFASEIGNSFSGVVASSSTPPGSSSGMGGGFSGGGGGGGGGGGW
jgi:uncharacterized membrane protein YgcG